MKYIRSLELKKNRRAEGVFVAEGPKVVGDMLPYFPCRLLVATEEWHVAHPEAVADEMVIVTDDETWSLLWTFPTRSEVSSYTLFTLMSLQMTWS